MKRLTALVLALVLALSLAACGEKKQGGGAASLLAKAAGLDADATLLTVDGRKVSAGQYLYWLAYTCDHITAYHASLGDAPNWAEPLSGETLGSYAKRQALQDTVLYATVENWAETHGCALTEADRADMDAAWAEKAGEYGGEEAYLAALGDMGLDRAGAEALSAHLYLYKHLYELYQTPGSPLHPAPEAVDAFGVAQGYVTASAIRIPAGDAAKEQAAKAFAALNESADPAAAFDALAETYSADPPAAVTAPGGSLPLPAACVQALSALEAGQWSGIVETEGSFYILLRRPLDREAVSADYFDSLLQTAADGAAVELSAAYGPLDAGTFAANLEKARTAGS